MRIPSTVWPGSPYPLGATWDGHGVNFAVYSENATLVQLCLFNDDGKEINKINLRWNSEGVWHCYLPQARPGLIYGYRAHGDYDPGAGSHFNPNKLLLDPYAKLICGNFRWVDEIYAYQRGIPGQHRRDARDSAPFVGKAVVVDSAFDWKDDRPPRVSLHSSVIYEMHVKGFSKRNPKVPLHLQGTYAGLGHCGSIEHLKRLGITAVELLPIQYCLSEGRLSSQGLCNYWGYNTLGFFAPDPRFAATADPVTEFKEMVRNLHDAGIEVILDVVYNHTAEQGGDGPCLCMRGLDNATYYRLEQHDASSYLNYTGCGNSLDTRNVRTLQLVADSLRYWVEEMHVDGFRFDLVTTLARTGSTNTYRTNANFLDILAQDPVLARVKLIAEPWDCGPDGYQVGRFPKGWSEWNGDWRDTMRRFWRGDKNCLGKLASKLSGSSDLYYARSPQASINFITAHDGFTLNDLVSYHGKRNAANGENNCDGTNDNLSWNCGHEGPTTDASVNKLRARQQRNMLFTLFLSQGIPMLTAGDEMARTQNGNNNAYCQDNDISYLHWDLTPAQQEQLSFTQRLIALRRQHHAFTRNSFFRGDMAKTGLRDVRWLNSSGRDMQNCDWDHPETNCLGMYIAGDCLDSTDSNGCQLSDDSFLLILNSDSKAVRFALPAYHNWAQWAMLLDTARYPEAPAPRSNVVTVAPHSCVLLAEIPRRGF